MSTILTDVANDTGSYTEGDAADALVNRWMDAGQLSSGGEDGETESATTAKPEKRKRTPIEEANEGSEEDTDDAEDEEHQEDDDEEAVDGDADDLDESEEEDGDKEDDKRAVSDDDEVEVVVDGEAKKVPVKDLKRLYGQEASLTRKSQEVAKLRKDAEESGARYTTAIQTLTSRAYEKWKPYSEIDYLVAQTQLSPEEFAALRQEAQAAFNEYKYFTEELDGHMKAHQEEQVRETRKQATEAIKVLTEEVPGWSNKLYDDIRFYGVSQGIPEADMNSIISPVAIKLIHKAMLYDNAKKVATEKKVKAPAKSLKATTKPARASSSSERDSLSKLRSTGNVYDAADVILQRMTRR